MHVGGRTRVPHLAWTQRALRSLQDLGARCVPTDHMNATDAPNGTCQCGTQQWGS